MRSGFCVALALWCVLLSAGGGALATVAPGDPLPSFSLPDVATGNVVEVKGLFEGHVGALVFMQTSCAACRAELMALSGLARKYPELRVVAVSVDSGGANRVARYREGYAFSFPFVHDPAYTAPGYFGFSFTPALVLVNRQGSVALLKGGYNPADEALLEKDIAELLP